MPTPIHQKVRQANEGKNPFAIIRLCSGWVVASETQLTPGYCMLLSDPVAHDLNSLDEEARAQYCLDMIRVGDALMKVTGSYRINYETWCNQDPALHTHIVPRFRSEPDAKRILPPRIAYDWSSAPRFEPEKQRSFIESMREALRPWERK